MDQHHRRIAKIALAAAGDYGLALAGGYAVSAHGMGNRPSGDVDLFSDWHRRADFPAMLDVVIAALEATGAKVDVTARETTFARLLVSLDSDEPQKVELSADWRSHPPVVLDLGPVLHPDDAVANKMCALYGRALPRDFLDIDAAITSGRYSRERLIDLATAADPGFDPRLFADSLNALTQITDEAFTQYDTPTADVAAMRKRFAAWRRELSQPVT